MEVIITCCVMQHVLSKRHHQQCDISYKIYLFTMSYCKTIFIEKKTFVYFAVGTYFCPTDSKSGISVLVYISHVLVLKPHPVGFSITYLILLLFIPVNAGILSMRLHLLNAKHKEMNTFDF